MNNILDDGVFPIVGWAGPSDEMIREDILSGMVEAGFTISHSSVNGGDAAMMRALDMAAKCGIRLNLQVPDWHVGDDFTFDEAKKKRIGELVGMVKDHPGLYGYQIRDEPFAPLLPTLAQVVRFIRDLDPYHLVYVNHNPPIEGWGLPTAEAFLTRWIELAQPQFLSYDHYPMTVATAEQIRRLEGEPYIFPEEKLYVKPDYFACLELYRRFSLAYNIPFWAFTNAVRHAHYPKPTEGQLRFQLMNDLVYGARGVQYFTYAHDYCMVMPDGSTTDTWQLAKRINHDIKILAGELVKLRNVGVFRTGKLWSGTQHLHRSHLPPLVECEGDPVTIGFFMDAEDRLYLMLVNGSPCSWARLTLRVNAGALDEYHLIRQAYIAPYPPNPRDQMLILAPGEGKLFRVGVKGARTNF